MLVQGQHAQGKTDDVSGSVNVPAESLPDITLFPPEGCPFEVTVRRVRVGRLNVVAYVLPLKLTDGFPSWLVDGHCRASGHGRET